MVERQPGLALEKVVAGYVVLRLALPLRVEPRGVRTPPPACHEPGIERKERDEPSYLEKFTKPPHALEVPGLTSATRHSSTAGRLQGGAFDQPGGRRPRRELAPPGAAGDTRPDPRWDDRPVCRARRKRRTSR